MAVFREVARIAARTRKAFDADDIAGEVALAVARHPSNIMAGYPDPVGYARQRARHAGISFDRSQRVQRGEGARLQVDKDGLQRPGRRYASADASPDALTHADPGAGHDVTVTEHLVTAALLQQACKGTRGGWSSSEQRWMLPTPTSSS